MTVIQEALKEGQHENFCWLSLTHLGFVINCQNLLFLILYFQTYFNNNDGRRYGDRIFAQLPLYFVDEIRDNYSNNKINNEYFGMRDEGLTN